MSKEESMPEPMTVPPPTTEPVVLAPSPPSRRDRIYLYIVAVFLPPLAVFLISYKITPDFWINLLLFLFGWFPGVLHALWVIHETSEGRRQ